MQAEIINEKGEVTGHESLNDEVFGAEVHEGLLWEAVKALRASKRRGTHDTKTRADVRGGGAKPLKQKGSGQARQGSRRAPNHVGGGTVFGPHPRDYSYRLPRSARRRALLSALSARAKTGNVKVLEGIELSTPKTAVVNAALSPLGGNGALLVVCKQEVLRRSARNLERAKGLDVDGINVYDILRFDHLVFTREALSALCERMADGPTNAAQAGAAA